uniref:Uncharacterized protein n=1 Tax=Lepeophtheirus salmonis TaxID=72036 RepID=A0A0K2UQQ0_LEPSM
MIYDGPLCLIIVGCYLILYIAMASDENPLYNEHV